jgi:hypothetical protein
MGLRLSLSKAYTDRCRSISRLKYDLSVNRTAESYFTTKVNKKQSSQRLNWMAVSNTMVQTKVVTSKHEDFNLMFTNLGKEDGIYPLKRDSTAQN